GLADFSIFTASNVSCPVPCSTESTEFAYMASKVLATGDALRTPIPKSLMLLTAIVGSGPERIRGSDGPSAMARKADLTAESGSACKARFSQPSPVAFTPGVPDCMKFGASKCESGGAGELAV